MSVLVYFRLNDQPYWKSKKNLRITQYRNVLLDHISTATESILPSWCRHASRLWGSHHDWGRPAWSGHPPGWGWVYGVLARGLLSTGRGLCPLGLLVVPMGIVEHWVSLAPCLESRRFIGLREGISSNPGMSLWVLGGGWPLSADWDVWRPCCCGPLCPPVVSPTGNIVWPGGGQLGHCGGL